jgi:hypothetical protein
MSYSYALCLAMSAWLSPVQADDLERLPPPRQAPVELVAPLAPMPPMPAYDRVSSYAVWQYYAVDRFNQWRPRVAISPYGGAYYLYDGSPYPFVPNQSYNVTTTMLGTPYRSGQ